MAHGSTLQSPAETALSAAARDQAAPDGQALIELLGQLGIVGLAALARPSAGPSFVEGLGQWLGWADAIPLSAALKAPAAPARAAPLPPPATPAALAASQALARVRAALLRAIADAGQTQHHGDAGRQRHAMPPAVGAAADTAAADFSPHRQRYSSLQQAMEAAIAPVRAQARAALVPLSPALAQLATLDAVMDKVLGSREQSLLAMMPSLLQKHFERLHAAHLQTQDAAAPEHHTPPPRRPPTATWLAVFRHDMQRLLRAELDLRLQPAWGLIEALNAHATAPLAAGSTRIS